MELSAADQKHVYQWIVNNLILECKSNLIQGGNMWRLATFPKLGKGYYSLYQDMYLFTLLT